MASSVLLYSLREYFETPKLFVHKLNQIVINKTNVEISYFITIIFITYITNIIITTNNNNRIITMNSNNTIIMRNNNITRSNITISIKIRFLSDLVSIQHFRNLENSMLWLA